jgi:hypothetical protein
LFFKTGSQLCSPGWPQTHDPLASTSQGLGLQAWTTMPGFCFWIIGCDVNCIRYYNQNNVIRGFKKANFKNIVYCHFYSHILYLDFISTSSCYIFSPSLYIRTPWKCYLCSVPTISLPLHCILFWTCSKFYPHHANETDLAKAVFKRTCFKNDNQSKTLISIFIPFIHPLFLKCHNTLYS